MIDKFWTRVYMFLLVHELEPKKMGIWLERVDKTINIFGTLRVSLSRKYDELSKSLILGQELRYFTHQIGPKGWPHGNGFWVFANWKFDVTNTWSV